MKIKLFLLFLIIFSISAPLFGELNRLDDTAGLLSEAEAASLEERLNTISMTYDFDMVIVSVKHTGNYEPKDFAEAFFKENGYGIGKNRDGCILLMITEKQIFWFSASGRGKKILTSAASKRLEKDAMNSLGIGDFYNTFLDYTETWEELLVLDTQGRTYNFLYRYNAVFVILAWLVSLGIGSLIVMIWKKSMSTAIPKKQDVTYITPGGVSFAVQQDKFLYSTVTKTERDSDSDSDDDDEATEAENSEDDDDD